MSKTKEEAVTAIRNQFSRALGKALLVPKVKNGGIDVITEPNSTCAVARGVFSLVLPVAEKNIAINIPYGESDETVIQAVHEAICQYGWLGKLSFTRRLALMWEILWNKTQYVPLPFLRGGIVEDSIIIGTPQEERK